MIDPFLSIQSLPPLQQHEALRSMKAEVFKQSLFLTAKHLLNYQDMVYRAHGDVVQALENNDKRKMIVMPRGSLKTSLCSVAFPIWTLLRNPNERILLDSELYTNSKNILREIKSHLENPTLVNLFGQFQTEPWNEGEITIAQRRKVYKEASITAGGVGTTKVGQHYSMIIMDDMNSPANSATKEGREKVIDHYKYSFSLLEPDGVIVLVGTRYSSGDLIGHILENEIGV